MGIIEIKNLKVAFPTKKGSINAVAGVSLDVAPGDIYGIVGFSGAGKSTLVRTVNLLQKPTAGDLKVNGQQFVKDGRQVISKKQLQLARRKIGMIFQDFNLLDETTVLENIIFALRHSQLSDEELEARAQKLLDLVDLADRGQAYPSQLSGGQKQRVAIARALANQPDILISDEATSALDPQNTEQILSLLARLNRKLGLTILLITHEMDAVKKVANKIAVMENGRIVEQGSLKQIFLHPQAELTKKFVGGSLNTIATLNSLHLNRLGKDEAIYQLTYSIANVTKSIIVDLYRQLGVEASMLYGNVELLGTEAIGTLVVLVKGNADQQQASLKFLQEQGVAVTRLNEKGDAYAARA
jgi:D-methionine transport system ATP-binding protein